MRNLRNDKIQQGKGSSSPQSDYCRNRRRSRTSRLNLLESALEAAFQTFDGQELYLTKEEKGARLGFALISNHAFVDGNKRIGMYVLLTFLEVNGIRLECDSDDIARVGLAVAAGTMGYAELLTWIREHRTC